MLFRCSRSQTYTDYLDMPVRRFQEEMDDDSGRSESSEEDGEEEEEEEDYGSEDDDVITPLRDRESWKSFFGSSVDLSPTLMTIYDSYSSSINVTPPPEYSASINPTSTLSADPSCGKPVRHQHLAKSCSDVRYENVQSIRRNNDRAMENLTESCMETDEGPSSRLPDDVPSALVNLVLPNDAKKRPLSVSSTSSSNSSTSSLPRHQRKKVATTSCLAAVTPTTCVATTISVPPNGITSPMDTSAGLLSASVIKKPSGRTSLSNLYILDEDVQKVKFTSSSGRNVYIDRVVGEILDSERCYVRDLNDIIQGYLRYILETPELSIPDEDVTALFGNIEAIYHFSRGFLECLEQCGHDAVSIASCFIDMTGGFDIYTQYCTNYPRSVVVLAQCVNNAELAMMFKQRQGMLGHGLPLGAYLLKPIQRVLKYHLLLQKIVNNFGENKPGYNEITKALNSMTGMAVHINEMKRKHEHTMRVQEIQSVLHDWDGHDLISYGDLILEDSFRMSGAKVNRQLFLFEKGFLVTKKREDGHLLVKAAIESSNLMLIESVPKEPLSFHIIPFNNPRVQYTAQARSLKQKRKWCREIKRLILENFQSVIPDKVKELVMELGKSREEQDLDDSLSDLRDQAPRQHSAPEYLERRRAGRRKSTSTILDFGLLKSRLAARKSPPVRRRSDITPPNIVSHVKPRLSDTAEEVSGEYEDSLQSIDDSSTECSAIDTTTQGSDTPRSSLTLEADNEDSASETETSPAWRRESLKKATEINRIDSQTAAMKQRCRRNATVERPEQFVFGLDVSDDDETKTREPSPDGQHSNRAEHDRSDESPDVSANGTLPRTSPSVHNSDDMSSSSTVDNSNANISELPETNPLSPQLGLTGETSLETSCSSPGPLSCSSQQGSDPWLPRPEPVICHEAKRTQGPDCDGSTYRSSVSPQRGFDCGLLRRSNSCSSLSDSVGDQGSSVHGCSTNVLQSPQMARQNTAESASGDKQEGRKHVEQDEAVSIHVISPKTETTTECSVCGGRDVDVNNATPVRCTCNKPPSGSTGVGSPRPSRHLDVYIPKYVTPNMQRFSTSRSNSFTDATQHAVKTAVSPTLSSPSSTTSTDSLVDSLRNAVGNIRSRLTRRHASGSNNSRMQRSRSASALDRIIPPSSPSTEAPSSPTKEKGRRRQNIFVQHLKRTYSERERKGNRFGGSGIISPGGDRKGVDTSNELMDLLKDKKQGSPAIGARYARPRPCSNNAFTLPNGKRTSNKSESDVTLVNTDNDAETPLPAQPASQLDLNVVATRAMTETRDDRRLAYDSGCVDTDILSASQSDISRGADVTAENVSDEMFKQLEIGSRNTLDSAETISNAPSVDSYYERRLAEELGMDAACNDDDAVFRDSAVYSDDGVLLVAGEALVASTADKCAARCVDSSIADNDNGITPEECVNNTDVESDNQTGAKVSVTGISSIIGDIAQSKQLVICDTVKSIHQRYDSASNAHAKSPQKCINKSAAFQDIVFSLEAGSGSEPSESPSPDVDACVSPSFKTAASRELVHCASLTRMRQDNASISDKHYTEEWPPRQRSMSQESDDDGLSMRIDDKARSPVNRARPPVTNTPLSHTKLSLSPSAESKTLLSSTPHPKFLWTPTSQYKSPSSLPKRKDVWPWSPVPTIASPEAEVPNEPTSPGVEYEELHCPSAVPYKARLTVNVHSMCADPTTDESAPDSPSSDSPAVPPMSPARRGWVKYRVKQLQADDETA